MATRIYPETLLMFSGGLDSTGVFYKLMQTKINLHVHHLYLENPENRQKAEEIAVKKITDYMRQFGDFTYSESYHKYPDFNGNFIWDSDIFSFAAGNICFSMPSIKNVAIGVTASDDNPNHTNRINRAHKIFAAFDTKAIKIYPVLELNKKQIYDMLPEDLRKLTWSCRKPIYKGNEILKCGSCKSCYEFKKSGII